MKRIIFILLLLCAFAASAQSHLEFNGIPIDGSVSAFTEKMKAAGYRVHPSSKKMPAGMRYFINSDKSNFDYLEYCSVCVRYDVRTKTVFCVSQVYEFKNTIGGLATSRRLLDETKARMSAAYPDSDSCGSVVMESVDGLPFYGVEVNNADCKWIGTITCRIDYNPVLSEKIYVFVEFSDASNSQKYLNP